MNGPFFVFPSTTSPSLFLWPVAQSTKYSVIQSLVRKVWTVAQEKSITLKQHVSEGTTKFGYWWWENRQKRRQEMTLTLFDDENYQIWLFKYQLSIKIGDLWLKVKIKVTQYPFFFIIILYNFPTLDLSFLMSDQNEISYVA